MNIDKVQLQQQEVVNNEVVLTDINPITTTNSVFDPATGSTMQDVLDRLWNSINNELSRVVNSVNNKTGVVVVTPGDIGLGNVDNISFTDIKEWVVDYFKKKMANYRFRLFNDLQEAETLRQTNDSSLDAVPFYAKNGFAPDKKSYIGYFYWDGSTEELGFNYKGINTIGEVDASLIYDEDHKGELKVRIHPDETALYLDDEDPIKKGLRIDPDKLSSKMIESRCLYGEIEDTNAMLSANQVTDRSPVRIFIDEVEVTTSHGHHLHKKWVESLKMHNLVMTSFDPFYTIEQRPGTRNHGPVVKGDPDIVTLTLMDRQPAVGVVTKLPDDSSDYYEIHFYSIKTFSSGYGLSYIQNHQEVTGLESDQLGIDFTVSETNGNESGLTAFFNRNGLLPEDASADVPPSLDLAYRNIQPYGYTGNHGTSSENSHKGLVIATDESICRYPIHEYNPAGDTYIEDGRQHYYGSKRIDNWSPLRDDFEVDSHDSLKGDMTPDGVDNGYPGATSLLSINMNKLVRFTNFEVLTEQPPDWDEPDGYKAYYIRKQLSDTMNDFIYVHIPERPDTFEPDKYYKFNDTDYRYHFTDVSGLKLINATGGRVPYDDTAVGLRSDELKELGIYDGKDSLGNVVNPQPFRDFSGGLAVNVGNFLEICPKETGCGEHYHDSGKVNVRIGKGLRDEGAATEVDTSSATNPPVDWYTNSGNFRFVTNNGKYIEIPIGYNQLDESYPDMWNNWNDRYHECYRKIAYGGIIGNVYAPIVDPEPPEKVAGEYYYFGPMRWFDAINRVNMHLYTSIVQFERSNRLSLDIDNKSLQFNNSTSKLEVSIDNKSIQFNDTDARLEVSIDNKSIKYNETDSKLEVSIDDVTIRKNPDADNRLESFPVIRTITDGLYHYGEIFASVDGQILYLVVDESGVNRHDHNEDDLVVSGSLKMFTSIDYDFNTSHIRHFDPMATSIVYTANELIECEITTNRNILARVTQAFKPNGRATITDYIGNQLEPLTKLQDDTTTVGVTKNIYMESRPVLREYDLNVTFVDCEMFTNSEHTGVYMTKETFTVEADEKDPTVPKSIQTYINDGKVLPIVSPT